MVRQNTIHQKTKQGKNTINTTKRTSKDCRICGNKFLPGHFNACSAKNEVCRIGKKIGHFARLCKSEMHPHPQYNMQQRRQPIYARTQQQQRHKQLATKQTQQRIRNINEEETKDTQKEVEATIDPELTCYIREMMEDWQNFNFIQLLNFTDEKLSGINQLKKGEFWIQTKTNSKQTYWLVDKGSQRISMDIETVLNKLVNRNTQVKHPEKSIGEFRKFNNKQYQHKRNTPSGYWVRFINSKKLYNTFGRHQQHQHIGKRLNGQTWTRSGNLTKKERRKKFN